MDDETKRLLLQFDDEQVVTRACFETHKQNMHFAVPQQIIGAWKEGLLEIRDNDGDLKDSKGLYSRLLILTEKGREDVGLPKLIPDMPKAKKAVSKQGALFE